MKNIIRCFIVWCFISNLIFAQLIEVKKTNYYSQKPIYTNDNGDLFSTIVKFKYAKKLASSLKVSAIVGEDEILDPIFKIALSNLKEKYGDFTITKAVPLAKWEDSLKVNKRTKQLIKVTDLSQMYRINFTNAVPINSVCAYLKSLPNVLNAEGPMTACLTLTPDDPEYNSANEWTLLKIKAEKAWDITTGSSTIRTAINDRFGELYYSSELHEDLIANVAWNNLNGNYGDHGILVAGIAGARSNNNLGIASLGWNTSLLLDNRWGPWDAVDAIYDLVDNQNADIINFSWVTTYDSELEDAIHYALQLGVICVASAGNTELTVPGLRYPAAFNFGNDGQVIAVSATQLNSGAEQFITGFNYSPGTDPDNDPENSFIDFAAPGVNIRALSITNAQQYYTATSPGTSISAPLVSALVSLIFSVNNTLTPNQVYEILRATSEKIGQYSYNNGWNRYLGYGRINAYEALKYTIEHFGGTLSKTVTIPAGEAWNIQPGVTLSFASNSSLIVNGTLNASGTSSSGITFTKSGANNWGGIQFNSGSSGNLQYCNIQNAGNGIYCYNSSPTIMYSTIDNNSSAGLYLNYYSSPVLKGNNFRFNGSYGLRSESYSSPNLTDNGYPGLNVIRNNSSGGILASYYSNPNLNGYMSSGNSLFDNTGYEIAASSNCTINAQRVYWGSGATTSATGGSTIDVANPLGSNPNDGRKIVADNSSNSTEVGVSLKVVADDLASALDKQKDKKYDEAIPMFLEVVKNNKDLLLGRYALCKIEECFTQSGKKDYLDYSKKEIKPLLTEGSEAYVVALELEAHQMVNAMSYKDAINKLQTILKKYNLNEAIEKNTLFSLGAFYTIYLGDKTNSDSYFEELKNKYPNDDLVNQIEIVKGLGLAANSSVQNGDTLIPIVETTPEVKTSVTKDAIINYPNPFNPSTQISFTLKERANISLKVYDVLGKEVANLADGYYEAGKHTATFDGSNLASGIYFYRLTTPTATITKKMMLVK